MQWLTPDLSDSANAHPVQRIGFDIIRAMVAARCATNPTIAALQKARQGHELGSNVPSGAATMAIINGRSPASESMDVSGGAFFSLRRPMGDRDDMVSQNGESHA